MKRIFALLLLLPALAFGGPNDIVMMQRNSLDTGLTPSRLVAVPTNGDNAILGYNGGSTQLPVFYGIGQGLSLVNGVLSASGGSAPTWASVTGKPDFATVATTGSYSDLLSIPSTFAPAAHTQAFSTITETPTTLAGYGITDAATSGALAGKFNTPTGTTAQYIRGDGSLATLPVARRIETYAGTTNAAGQIVVTYGMAYPVTPVVQPPAPALANQVWTTVSSTPTGFTLQLNQRNTVTLLSTEVLLGATVPVVGAAVTVLVVAQ